MRVLGVVLLIAGAALITARIGMEATGIIAVVSAAAIILSGGDYDA